MLFGSKKVVGLDIGSSSIKVAEIEVSRNGAKVLSMGIAPSPSAAFNNGDIHDPDSLSQAIAQLMRDYKIKRKQVALGLSGTSVIVKKITIPRIDKKLLADQVRWEAEQYIPFDVNSISLAYHLIPNSTTPEMMDLLLVAAQNEVVRNYAGVVERAGLELSVLDVSGFALANIFEFNYGRVPGQTIGLLNIGATTTNFVVVYDGEVIFTRDMNVGGQNYTSEIHKDMGISLHEAETLKLSAVRGEGVPDEVHSVMSSTNEALKEEVRNSFDYFAGSATSLSLNQCFFTGGASLTPGLIDSISAATNVRLDPLNPVMRMTPGSKNIAASALTQMGPFISVVLGLALRKAGDK